MHLSGQVLCTIMFLDHSVFSTRRNWNLPKLLDNSTEQSPWEANSRSASQIPHIVLNSKVHYHLHKTPWLVSIPSQINPVHTFTSYFPKIHSKLFLTKILYAFLISPMRATCFPISPSLIWPRWCIWWSVQVMKFLQKNLSSGFNLSNRNTPEANMLWLSWVEGT